MCSVWNFDTQKGKMSRGPVCLVFAFRATQEPDAQSNFLAHIFFFPPISTYRIPSFHTPTLSSKRPSRSSEFLVDISYHEVSVDTHCHRDGGNSPCPACIPSVIAGLDFESRVLFPAGSRHQIPPG